MDAIDKLIAESPERGRPKSKVEREFKRLRLRADIVKRVDDKLAKPGFDAQPTRGISPNAWRDLIEQLLVRWLKENP